MTCSNPDCPDCHPEPWPDEEQEEKVWWWPYAVAFLLALAGVLAIIIRAPTP